MPLWFIVPLWWMSMCLCGGCQCASVVHCASVVDVSVPLWFIVPLWWISVCLCGGCQCASVVDVNVPLWWMLMCLCG